MPELLLLLLVVVVRGLLLLLLVVVVRGLPFRLVGVASLADEFRPTLRLDLVLRLLLAIDPDKTVTPLSNSLLATDAMLDGGGALLLDLREVVVTGGGLRLFRLDNDLLGVVVVTGCFRFVVESKSCKAAELLELDDKAEEA